LSTTPTKTVRTIDLVRFENLVELAEAIIQLYPTEQGGRKVPLKIGSLIYNLDFRVSKDSRWNPVTPIGGASEIQPSQSGLIQVAFLLHDRESDPALKVGCHFYLFEGSNIIGEGQLTRRWQASEVEDAKSGHERNCLPTTDEVRAWAYDENAWLADQDEDLLLCQPPFISILKDLVSDPACAHNKREAILTMLKLHGIPLKNTE
jgi:hypothetical protein